MKKLVLTLAILSFKIVIIAQGLGLTFSQTAGTYTTITGGTVLVSGVFDDTNFPVTLPTAFTFKGISYNQITVNTNGWISLGSTAPSNTINTPVSSTASVPGFIAPFGMNLENADAGTPEIRWEQSGNEIIFQWKDVKRTTAAINSEIFSLQLRLNTTNGAMQFVYGSFQNITISTSSPQVGIRAATSSYPDNIYNRVVNTFFSNTWATSVEGTSANGICRITSTIPAFFPIDGQTYTWTPIDCASFSCTANLSPINGSTINSTTANLSWNTVAGAISYNLYFGNSLPLTLQGNYTSTTATITNLIANTAYSWYIAPVGFNCILSGCESAITTFNSGCQVLSCVSNIAPVNGATVSTSAVTLNWSNAGVSTPYDIYLGTTNPPTTLYGTFTGTSKTLLFLNDTYYWYAFPRISCSSPSSCNINTTQFTISNPNTVPNDICAGAIDLLSQTALGSIFFDGHFEFFNPAFCGNGSNRDVWYKFKAIANTASVTVVGVGSPCSFDPGISVYAGNCNALICLGQDDIGNCSTTNIVSLSNLIIGNFYYVRIFTVNSISGNFMMSGSNIGSTVLPLNLISFSGSKQNNDALLQWKTANEINVSRFEVQRSDNGVDFTVIGTVLAGGSEYSFPDVNTFSSRTVAFYRLKSIDVDGRFTFSNIIKLSKQASAAVTVYPNPVSDVLTISRLQQNGTLRIYNTDGKLLQQQTVSAQTMTIDMSKYAKGMYLLQYKTEEEVVNRKIIKQ